MRVSLFLVCFFYSFLSFSQQKIQAFSADFVYNEQCATEFVHKRKMLEDKSYKTNFQSPKIKKSATDNEAYVIPIVVHVMHLGEPVGTGTNISDSQIQSAIDRINAQYGEDNSGVNTGISFCLASLDPQGQFTTGINRVNTSGVDDYSLNGITNDVGSSENEDLIKSLSNWSNLEYYNVWIVSEIDGNDGGSGTQGYAYYSSAGSYENEFDGAVILHNSFGYDPNSDLGYNLKSYTRLNATFAHEMGHALNLKHTFHGDEGGSSCPENFNCFIDGDEVCDTDPHSRNDGGCDDSGPTCIGNGTDLSDVVINYMSYSAQSCKTKFSIGQKDRMVEAILNDRSTLLQSLACTGVLIFGCTDSEACNYDNSANSDDGSCEYVDAVCDTCVDGLVVDNDADNDGICDDDEIETYNCINDQCIDPGNNMGQYLSFFDCQSSCNPFTETYNCINNQCVDLIDGTGIYSSLEECEANCNSVKSTWDCSADNVCFELSDGSGNYQSLDDCEANCSSTSISENLIDVNIYPNPSSNIFILELNSSFEAEILVTNVLGEQVYFELTKSIGEFNTQIDLSNYSKGIYNLTIKTSDKMTNHKLILH